jgi:transposase-like protein
VIRYSEAFKRTIVAGLESGRFRSIEEVRQRYGIRGGSTVKKWVEKYGRNDLLAKVVRVETPDERDELKRLRRQVRELEQALAKTRVRELVNEARLEVAFEDSGEKDFEAFKKKLADELSRRRGGGEGGIPK